MHRLRSVCWIAEPPRSVTRPRLFWAFVLTFVALVFASQPASARFIQQGSKLVGTGAVGTANQGSSVALSADGNTAIFGGPDDSGYVGAAWVWTRSGGAWTQQSKLVGIGGVGTSEQGSSVALSADGNTAIVGGIDDNNNATGAAWVFTRTSGVWAPQGQKLVGTGAVGAATQGESVALSADGNTAIVGGPNDNNGVGAAWVFTRDNGVWTQQQKLVGTGNVGMSFQGKSVALSADGNTAIVGGPDDSNSVGAAWVFARDSNGVWTQPRPKLVGPPTAGNPQEGFSVALAGDGNTAILGGPLDNSNAGAAWVFISSGGGGGAWSWSQRLVGTGAGGAARQGTSVALSDDGNTFILGGPSDVNNAGGGAAWVFTRGINGVAFSQQGSKLVGTGAVGTANQGSSVELSADGNTAIFGGPADNNNVGAAWVFFQNPAATHDFNGDGKSDVVFRNTNTGGVAMWLMNGSHVTSNAGVTGATAGTPWQMAGTTSLVASTGDFNGDGKTDLVFRNTTTGGVAMWLMNGSHVTSSAGVTGAAAGLAWQIIGVGDFNGDGKADILWRNPSTGAMAMWLMNGSTVTANAGVTGAVAGTAWQVAGIGDFNGDGKADIVFRNTNTGGVAMWLMNGSTVTANAGVTGAVAGTAWQIVGVGDFNGDGKADVLFRNGSTGGAAMWLMNGSNVTANAGVSGAVAGTAWQVVSIGDYNGDGKSDVLFRNTSTGGMAMWLMNGSHVTSNAGVSGAVAGTAWTVVE